MEKGEMKKVRVRNKNSGVVKFMYLHIVQTDYAKREGWVIEDPDHEAEGMESGKSEKKEAASESKTQEAPKDTPEDKGDEKPEEGQEEAPADEQSPEDALKETLMEKLKSELQETADKIAEEKDLDIITGSKKELVDFIIKHNG